MLRSLLCVLATLLSAASEPTMVEVRTGGDDGLTQRFADQVRTIFAAAPAYTSDTTAKRLLIYIPTHVQWRKIHGNTKITYYVEITSGSKSIHRTGSCWEEDMNLCANQILKATAAL